MQIISISLRRALVVFIVVAAFSFGLALPTHAATTADLQAQIDTLKKLLASLQAELDAVSNAGSPWCTISATPSHPRVGERFKVSWETHGINDPIFYESLPGGGSYEVRAKGSLTFSENSVYRGRFEIGEGYDNGSLCSVTVLIGEQETGDPELTLIKPHKGTYDTDDTITFKWKDKNIPIDSEYVVNIELARGDRRQLSQTISQDDPDIKVRGTTKTLTLRLADFDYSSGLTLIPGSYRVGIWVTNIATDEWEDVYDQSDSYITIVD